MEAFATARIFRWGQPCGVFVASGKLETFEWREKERESAMESSVSSLHRPAFDRCALTLIRGGRIHLHWTDCYIGVFGNPPIACLHTTYIHRQFQPPDFGHRSLGIRIAAFFCLYLSYLCRIKHRPIAASKHATQNIRSTDKGPKKVSDRDGMHIKNSFER